MQYKTLGDSSRGNILTLQRFEFQIQKSYFGLADYVFIFKRVRRFFAGYDRKTSRHSLGLENNKVGKPTRVENITSLSVRLYSLVSAGINVAGPPR